MGGINHQPCKHYLPESTKLSRAMSLARMSFEQANVCLEDLVLSELAGGAGSVDPIMEHLRGSTEHLTEMEACANRLFGKMDELHFVDLPPLKTIDFGALGTKLVNMGMVSPESWGCVVRTTKVGGFRSILTMIRERFGICASAPRPWPKVLRVCRLHRVERLIWCPRRTDRATSRFRSPKSTTSGRFCNSSSLRAPSLPRSSGTTTWTSGQSSTSPRLLRRWRRVCSLSSNRFHKFPPHCYNAVGLSFLIPTLYESHTRKKHSNNQRHS